MPGRSSHFERRNRSSKGAIGGRHTVRYLHLSPHQPGSQPIPDSSETKFHRSRAEQGRALSSLPRVRGLIKDGQLSTSERSRPKTSLGE